jgi:RNA polymerase sigma-70 factor (ECF subfamily)
MHHTAANADTTRTATQHLTLEAVYRDHHDFVWRSVRRLGLGEGEVDDAVQDVFMVVHRRLSQFEGRSSVRTWLFGIAMRVVKDHRRRGQRAERRVRAYQEPHAVTGPCPEDQVAKVRAVELLDNFLEVLDPDKRAVFVLADFEGMTAPEIAEILGVKLNTVYSRLRLARKRFETVLEEIRSLPREDRKVTYLQIGERAPAAQFVGAVAA